MAASWAVPKQPQPPPSAGVDPAFAAALGMPPPDDVLQVLPLGAGIAAALFVGWALARVLPRVWQALLFMLAWTACKLLYDLLQNSVARAWLYAVLHAAGTASYAWGKSAAASAAAATEPIGGNRAFEQKASTKT
jgi:hypothetical protein